MKKLADIFPVIGGAGGALDAAIKIDNFPSIKSILIYIILTILGALIGYFVKLLLDHILKKPIKND